MEDKPAIDWSQLTFSFKETDAMFVAQTNDRGQWGEGSLVPAGDLRVSPASAALNYGQAAFEGMKAQRTNDGRIVLFRPWENARRLRKSAARLMMPPYPDAAFIDAVEQMVRANLRWMPPFFPERALCDQCALYIRPVMIGSGPILGVNPAPSYTFYIFACPVGRYLPGEGRILVLDSAHRAAPNGTGGVKAAGNYGSTLLPHHFAHQRGYKDALYLDARHNRYIEELGSSNFFAFLKDGTLVTPPLTGTILPGITRDSAMTVAQEVMHWPVIERDLAIDEVLELAEEAFFTGTAAVVQPITTIHYKGTDHLIGPGVEGKRTQQLRDHLIGIQRGQQDDPWGWVHEVRV